jgi:hypothetical protein
LVLKDPLQVIRAENYLLPLSKLLFSLSKLFQKYPGKAMSNLGQSGERRPLLTSLILKYDKMLVEIRNVFERRGHLEKWFSTEVILLPHTLQDTREHFCCHKQLVSRGQRCY